MMPVALGMTAGSLVTEIAAGCVYCVYAAGDQSQQLTLQLGPALDVNGPNASNPLDVSGDNYVSPRKGWPALPLRRTPPCGS